ncbi:Putative porin [Dysgonomonas macrotermitis]|uniref:Putative porin n=3 Tax=Dysgonomonas macrotermitis TaxID=1346286 RepID=A0A1M4WPJ0_9BACT|nr:Putative porin [Dysgonomonas macrotermitis]
MFFFGFLCKFATMKRFALVSAFICICVLTVSAQTPRFIFDNDSLMQQIETPQAQPKPRPIPTDSTARASMADSLSKIPPAIPAWNIDERFGERIPIIMDTMFINFHNETLVEGYDVAVAYLGNIGSPAQSRIFFNRPETSQFPVADAFYLYHKRPGNQRFIDTKKPYSNIFYQTGGSSLSKEDRFSGEMAISLNKKLSFGFNADYLYARGYYAYLANKQNNYDLWASYRTDNYQMHAFIANNNYTNAENGGLADDDYLTGNVGGAQINTSKTQEFPVNIESTWNKLRGRHIYLTNKYSLGYRKDDDSETFVPVASIIFTNNYTDQQRRFHTSQPGILSDYYGAATGSNTNSSLTVIDERMSYWSFKNTLAVALNEGFRPWVKFGLTAFIEQDTRKYQIPGEKYPSFSSEQYSQNSTTIGGVLSKDKGRFLHYNLSASFGVLGYNIGESRLTADISSRINIKGKDAIIKADAYIKNLKPTFFENHFMSAYRRIDEDLSDVRRVYIGGEIIIPHTKTRIKGGVENIENYIYYQAPDSAVANIKQAGKSIQVVSLQLDQNFSFRALHWDNQLVFQTSSDESVLPLPKFNVYSNLYIKVKLAKVLGIQLGVDARYFTEYNGPGYDPVTLQFYNQEDQNIKIGNFPLINAYANFHLKKTRFFVMMYNIGKDFNNSRYFSAVHYPINPMIFKMGLSWNFTD